MTAAAITSLLAADSDATWVYSDSVLPQLAWQEDLEARSSYLWASTSSPELAHKCKPVGSLYVLCHCPSALVYRSIGCLRFRLGRTSVQTSDSLVRGHSRAAKMPIQGYLIHDANESREVVKHGNDVA